MQTLCLEMRELVMLRLKKGVEVYETLEDLVTKVSSTASSNVRLDNVKCFLFYLGSFMALALMAAVMDRFRVHSKVRSIVHSIGGLLFQKCSSKIAKVLPHKRTH